MLHELPAGRRAFWGATVADTVSAILDKDRRSCRWPTATFARARADRRSVPEKDPAARFQSARDLTFALEAPRFALLGWARRAGAARDTHASVWQVVAAMLTVVAAVVAVGLVGRNAIDRTVSAATAPDRPRSRSRRVL
jgi:hypothetical protein